jgi:2-polyprenyl-3-methyl-5-hydroxy-6-metoxy-1,4-benzoquinol methylase
LKIWFLTFELVSDFELWISMFLSAMRFDRTAGMNEKYVMHDKVPARLKALQEAVDPATFRRIKSVGLARGWQCWEVGAGGGSVAFWLCGQVGEAGRVLATDIHLDLIEEMPRPLNLRLLQHDVGKDDAPAEFFDLIHTRVVLMHGGINRDTVIGSLVSALKPGGWLVLEEHDKYGTFNLMPTDFAFAKALLMLTQTVESNGGSLSWARDLPTLLQNAGLVDVNAEIDAPLFRGGSPYARFWGHSFDELRQQIMSAGMTRDEVDLAIAQAKNSNLWLSCHAMIAAWGRKPQNRIV